MTELLDLRAQLAASKAQAEQRAAELAIVNGVQTALADRLEMQAIYDLVGETIRETFKAQGVGMSINDRDSGLVRRCADAGAHQCGSTRAHAGYLGLSSGLIPRRDPCSLAQPGSFHSCAAAVAAACARRIKLGWRIPSFGVCPKDGMGGTRNHSSVYGTRALFRRSNFVAKLKPAARYASPSAGEIKNSPELRWSVFCDVP